MAKTEKNCKNCNKLFLAENKEINRGLGLFCTLTCASIYNNVNSKYTFNKESVCKHCGKSFLAKNIAKYCSTLCKAKNYRLKCKSGNIYDKQLLKELKMYPCEICNWSEASRDVHHILPVSKGGKNLLNNLISLCPNHHRMVHKDFYSSEYLTDIILNRNITTSLNLLLNKIEGDSDINANS